VKLTLQADGLDDLVLGEAGDPYGLKVVDLGAPAVRESLEEWPGADGEIDSTVFEGGRTITAVVQLLPWTFAKEKHLKAFTRSRLRPTMTIELDDGTLLQATVRGLPFSSELTVEWQAAGLRLFPVQWRVASGVLESAELHKQTILAGTPDADGLEFGSTLEFGPTLEFPDVAAPGTGPVTNAGDRPATAVLRAYGPFGGSLSTDNVTIGNQTTGKYLVFAGLQVLAGEFVEIDLRAKTILLNADPTQSLYDKRDPALSDWWVLEPGVNVLVFQPETYSGAAQMHVLWRDAYS
jgi:hypothetical protein